MKSANIVNSPYQAKWMGTFIQITLQAQLLSAELKQQLIALCPVDIFEMNQGEIAVRPDEEDECTLCNLCLETAPPQAITIYKTYKNETLVSGSGLINV
jgi:ferredoxin-like protein FixX